MATHDVIQVLALLQEYYPQAELTEARAAVYVDLLQDIPGPALKQATRAHMATQKWFPTVAELRQPALDLLEAADPVIDAEAAWGLVVMSFRGRGQPDTRLIQEAVQAIGGWRMLGNSDDGDMIAHRSHFIRAYDNVARRYREEQRMLPSTREYLALQAGGSEPGNATDAIRRLSDGMKR